MSNYLHLIFLETPITDTMPCHYNTVKFLQNIHKGHPIARPLGWGMVLLLTEIG